MLFTGTRIIGLLHFAPILRLNFPLTNLFILCDLGDTFRYIVKTTVLIKKLIWILINSVCPCFASPVIVFEISSCNIKQTNRHVGFIRNLSGSLSKIGSFSEIDVYFSQIIAKDSLPATTYQYQSIIARYILLFSLIFHLPNYVSSFFIVFVGQRLGILVCEGEVSVVCRESCSIE